jgi:4-hydroxybenzoate polyprenyltransferase
MKIGKILNLIWNEFVYGGHLLSLGAASIVFTSALLLNIKVMLDFIIIAYLGTHAPYLYNRYKEFHKDILTNPSRTKHIEKYVNYIPIIIISYVIIIIGLFIYFNKISTLVFGFILLLFAFFYSKFFKKYTKKIVGFKSLYVSLAWSLLVILLALYYSFSLNLALLLILMFVFLRWVINTSLFDVKDIESDKKDGLLTLAIYFGRGKLIKILHFINIISILPIIVGFYLKLYPIFSLSLLFVIPYAIYYLNRLGKLKTNPGFLYYVLIDGEFVLWTILVLLDRKSVV